MARTRNWLGLGLALAPWILAPAAAWCQAARTTDTQAFSLNVTAVNGGGFSIMSEGGLLYAGPINAISPLEGSWEVRIVINDQVLVEGVPPELQPLVDKGLARINALSPELVAARLEPTGSEPSGLAIGGRLPIPIAIGASLESQRSVEVDGQSLSVFPDLQPSVFSRNLLQP